MAVHVDVTDPSSIQRMVEATVKEFGRIDHNINAAGVRSFRSFSLNRAKVLILPSTPDRQRRPRADL